MSRLRDYPKFDSGIYAKKMIPWYDFFCTLALGSLRSENELTLQNRGGYKWRSANPGWGSMRSIRVCEGEEVAWSINMVHSQLLNMQRTLLDLAYTIMPSTRNLQYYGPGVIDPHFRAALYPTPWGRCGRSSYSPPNDPCMYIHAYFYMQDTHTHTPPRHTSMITIPLSRQLRPNGTPSHIRPPPRLSVLLADSRSGLLRRGSGTSTVHSVTQMSLLLIPEFR